MLSPTINVMSAAAIKAGKGLVRDFGEVGELQISRKGPANFVTKSDMRTEKLLQRELLKARPSYGFLMEEGGEVPGAEAGFRWIIDPLDGTSNFIHAIPYFCISIGLEQRSGSKSEIVAGVIFDPIHNELFSAEKNKGAFVNGRRMAVSSRDKFDEAMLVTGRLTSDSDAMARAGATVRCLGATALDLANLAAGRIDACWYRSIKPWDLAAGLLLVAEAGGTTSELDGKPAQLHSQALLGSNRHLHLPMQKLLASAA